MRIAVLHNFKLYTVNKFLNLPSFLYYSNFFFSAYYHIFAVRSNQPHPSSNPRLNKASFIHSTACIRNPSTAWFLRIRLLGSISSRWRLFFEHEVLETIFYDTKFCLALSFVRVFERERIVIVSRKVGIFGLIIFP